MYNSPHQTDESANLNQSRYSAPPSTSRFDPTKPPAANQFNFHNHPLSLLNTAASLPHLNEICPPSGPMSFSSGLLPPSATGGASEAASPSTATSSAFLKTAGRPAGTGDLVNFVPHSQALSKHWIWNSSFFYPHSRHHQQPPANNNTATAPTAGSIAHSAEGFQPYFPGSFAPSFTKSPSSPVSGAVVIDLPLGGGGGLHTNTATTSGSDVTSEDSFDPDDAKNPYRTPPPSPNSAEHQHQQQSLQHQHHHHNQAHHAHQHQHHQQQMQHMQHQHEPSSSFVEMKKKARNPYSIEELLKKPEPKRQRLMDAASLSPSAASTATTTTTTTSIGLAASALPPAVTTFHPSVVIDDRSRSTMGTPESPTVVIDSSSHSDDEDSFKNEAIEICD